MTRTFRGTRQRQRDTCAWFSKRLAARRGAEDRLAGAPGSLPVRRWPEALGQVVQVLHDELVRHGKEVRLEIHAHGYHDFVLAQGLLPPDLLEQAVMGRYVPSQLAKSP